MNIHGMASWYGRTRMMQHRLFFDKLRTSQPTPARPNGVPVFFMMPDANVAGPIVKNKTFFFIGYQRLHEKKVAQVDATTPTELMKAGNFNFPGVAANVIFDPATTRRDANGNWARDPFPGNICPRIASIRSRGICWPSIRGSLRTAQARTTRLGRAATCSPTSSQTCFSTTTISASITSSTRASRSMEAGPRTARTDEAVRSTSGRTWASSTLRKDATRHSTTATSRPAAPGY